MKDTTLFLIIGFAVAISLVPTMRIAVRYAANCDRMVPASHAPLPALSFALATGRVLKPKS